MSQSLFDLSGKTAVVVGGTSGIGRVLALGLADAGADVVVTARREALIDEVAGLFANRDNPHLFLVHDINFHRAVADSAKNPIVGALVGMVSALYYERRRETAALASDRDLRDAAEAHRRIYQAIRARDAEGARRAMNEHLLQAARYQAQEPAPAQPAAKPEARVPRRRSAK